MKPTIVYISSDNRSGSTLLEQLLGSNPKVASVGEVVHLDAYVLEDRSLYDPRHPLVCSCGERLADCPFWTRVSRRVNRPLEELKLMMRPRMMPGLPLAKRLRGYVVKALMGPLVSLNRLAAVRAFTGGDTVARDSFELFDAIGEATGAEIVVDSSKDPYRFLNLYLEQPERMKVILLARDYRGVVHSKMKLGVPLERAITAWRRRYRRIANMARLLPESSRMQVTYEELCLDTESVMRRICAFVGATFTPAMLSRTSRAMHGIGGSPSKFDLTKGKVAIDRSYLNAFSTEQFANMRSIAGREATRWGYTENGDVLPGTFGRCASRAAGANGND